MPLPVFGPHPGTFSANKSNDCRRQPVSQQNPDLESRLIFLQKIQHDLTDDPNQHKIALKIFEKGLNKEIVAPRAMIFPLGAVERQA